MGHNDIALIGLGVMGSNLALNIADHGYKIAVYNYTADLVEKFQKETPHENAEAFTDIKAMVASLKVPRKIIIMVTAGKPVDAVLRSLDGLIEKDDIVMDLGNSNFEDTRARSLELAKKGIIYAGVGVSGGAAGARKGPAIMPGGTEQSYGLVGKILEDISAKASDGKPCCAYMGTDGAGHFVKMVHNGIEYADMQLIAESYLLLKRLGNFSNDELADIFSRYNEGELKSYLISITSKVFAEKNPYAPGSLVDDIKDSAGQKGTGKWTAISGFNLGVDLSLIDSACNCRFSSAEPEVRSLREDAFVKPISVNIDKEELIDIVEKCLYLGKIAAYAQGFALYKAGSDAYNWNLRLGKIAEIFRGGCIIQAKFLNDITNAFAADPELKNLIDAPFFKEKINKCLPSARKVAALAVATGIPVPTFMQAISYIDTMSTPIVGANLIQGLRDYFGAHTFTLVHNGETIHHNWSN